MGPCLGDLSRSRFPELLSTALIFGCFGGLRRDQATSKFDQAHQYEGFQELEIDMSLHARAREVFPLAPKK